MIVIVLLLLIPAPTLFAKGSTGAAPDTVHGLALCRGDANASACGGCVATAIQHVQQLCAHGNDATIFYDPCLRFSDEDFLENYSPDENFMTPANPGSITEPTLPGWDPRNAESVAAITGIVNGMIGETAKRAAFNSTRKYATGSVDVSSTFPPLYSMAQCTPDMPPADCWDCLQSINGMTTAYFSGRQGGRVLGVRCNFMYEKYVCLHKSKQTSRQ